MPFKPVAHRGMLHHYAPRLVAFEHDNQSTDDPSASSNINFILFLGGLTDDLLTVRYPSILAREFSHHFPGPAKCTFSVVEVTLSSSGQGWTTGSLIHDCRELAKAVEYFRNIAEQRQKEREDTVGEPSIAGKIILVGHSTGAQIALSYVVGSRKDTWRSEEVLGRPGVNGIFLQAGLSDREAIAEMMGEEKLGETVRHARLLAKKDPADHMPRELTKRIYSEEKANPDPQPSAKRWLSLAGPDGDDDFFSSDLSDELLERIWGKNGGIGMRGIPVCVLWGQSDPFVPTKVNKETLLERWREVVERSGGRWHKCSGVLPGGTHNYNDCGEAIVKALCSRIIDFTHDVSTNQPRPSEKSRA